MIDWLNCRQRAIDAAKRDTPHKAVEVWHYTEVNHVQVAIEGRKAVTNMVLPHVQVDFVCPRAMTPNRPPAAQGGPGFHRVEVNS